ncbi:MAG: glycosyltransferase [Sarcina sp.]
MINLSIIMPVYNAEKYLIECLNSVINQTINSKEVIIINDGSVDNSLEIIQEFATRYDFIKVIDKENEGVAVARNIGLKVASGRYIGFVDCDDILDKNMFKEMFEIADKYQCSMVECGYERFKNIEECNFDFEDEPLEFLDGKEVFKTFLNRMTNGYLWNKIYDSEIIKRISLKFPLVRCFEDILFNMQFIFEMDKYCKINKTYYKYRFNEQSLSSQIQEKEIIMYAEQRNLWLNWLATLDIDEFKKYIISFKVRTYVEMMVWCYQLDIKKYKTFLTDEDPKIGIATVGFSNEITKGLKVMYIGNRLNLTKLVQRIIAI